jgi:signal transduction histidine kinase
MLTEQEMLAIQLQVNELSEKFASVDHELKQSRNSQTEFLTRMSHELNSPLSVILGFAQLLEKSSLTDEQQGSLSEIIDAANYLNQQNEHLFKLALAKNAALTFDSINVKKVIDATLQKFADVILKKTIQIDLGDGLEKVIIKGDQHYFEQIINNLLLNAIHYTNDLGTVKVSFQQQHNSVKLFVEDEGEGIPTQLYSEVFTLFHDRNVENVQGLGMGLYLAKEYVELMKGEIGFESVSGQGTTFWVILPTNGA